MVVSDPNACLGWDVKVVALSSRGCRRHGGKALSCRRGGGRRSLPRRTSGWKRPGWPPTPTVLSRWVGSRHLPPRREALWRRLGRRVAERLGRHVTVLESRTTERQARHTSMQARPATESYWVLTSYHIPITPALCAECRDALATVGHGAVGTGRHRSCRTGFVLWRFLSQTRGASVR